MTKFHPQSVKIRLCDIENRIPSVKPLFDKVVEVVRDTQLSKDACQFSHTVGCVWKPSRACSSEATFWAFPSASSRGNHCNQKPREALVTTTALVPRCHQLRPEDDILRRRIGNMCRGMPHRYPWCAERSEGMKGHGRFVFTGHQVFRVSISIRGS